MTSSDPVLEALEDEGFHHPSLVATGSSADVFSAIDDENRLVAIKVLNQELAEIGNYRSQFLSTTARLDQLCTDNPNDVLVSILGTGEVGERPYLVMPYSAGGSLQERLEVSRTLGAPGRRATAALVASVLSEGLGLVHEAGLLHRDVKPSNVLILPTAWPHHHQVQATKTARLFPAF